jgi:hypothetical protein
MGAENHSIAGTSAAISAPSLQLKLRDWNQARSFSLFMQNLEFSLTDKKD